MKLKIVLFFSLFICLGGVTSCSKKGKTSSVEKEAGRPVESDRPAFVTDQPKESQKTTEIPKELSAISFSEKEMDHVRIVDYNPFGKSDKMTICLDQLEDNFCYPYPGNMTSDYGMRGRAMHTGIDIQASHNDTVRTALCGVVRMSKFYSGYGNIVVIRHPCGIETAYAHNAKNLVKPNDIVRGGDPIALAGRTGQATGVHVHFETRVMGEHFDPNLFIDPVNKTFKGGDLYLSREDGRILASNSNAPERQETINVTEKQIQAQPDIPTITLAQLAEASGVSDPSNSNDTSAKTNTYTSSASPEYHTIERGDTLFSLSRQYGLSVDEICELNGISRDGVLSLGQRIRIK